MPDDLASQIATKAKAILEQNMIITDINGVVIKTTSNLASHKDFLSSALQVSQKGQPLMGRIKDIDVRWCPFVYDNKTLAIFGIEIHGGILSPEGQNLITGMAEVITQEYFIANQLRSSQALRSIFIDDLLNSSKSTQEAYSQADILNIQLRSAACVLIINLDNFEEAHINEHTEPLIAVNTAIEATIRHLEKGFRHNEDDSAYYVGDNCFIVLKAVDSDSPNTNIFTKLVTEKALTIQTKLSEIHHGHISIGIGQYYPNLSGLRRSYQDALLSINVGVKLWGKGKVYNTKDIGMFMSFATIPASRKVEFALHMFKPLLKDQQLFNTTIIFLKYNLNLSDASKKLHIHRNTLIYRLDKVRKLIGLDPRKFEQALQIKLGLLFYKI